MFRWSVARLRVVSINRKAKGVGRNEINLTLSPFIKTWSCFRLLTLLLPYPSLSQTNVVRVSGMSNPYLAGMPTRVQILCG